MSPAKLKPLCWIRISKYCVNKGCKRIGTLAKRMSSGFWIVMCDDCQGKTITLDMGKIPDEKPNGWTPGDPL
jgi:hypothetical protein